MTDVERDPAAAPEDPDHAPADNGERVPTEEADAPGAGVADDDDDDGLGGAPEPNEPA